jgi:phosphoribosylamine--glycine ligase
MNKLDILVVGGGGREHAIIKKLAESPRCGRLYACPGNGGMADLAECLPVSATDIAGMVALASEKAVDLVVVAPDNPLVMGMVDALAEAGIRAFGPNKAAAIIEGSKAFSKALMQKYAIPTADYALFDRPDDAMAYIRAQNRFPVVIKADGLALGKGVVIAECLEDAAEAIKAMMEDKIFGGSGSRVVVEEFLTGPEVSVLAFCDGKTLRPMVSSMDHKRAGEGNTGPNTGGMGVIAPNPHYTPEVAKICEETIFLPTVRAMEAEGRLFKGCLYFGLMLTPKGPKVIEYNCRFGDPETQAVLPLLEGDLIEIMEAVIDGRLSEVDMHFKQAATACVIMASGGYPGSYQKGLPITGIAAAEALEGVTVYQAGTARDAQGRLVTSGGRVLGVTALSDTPQAALEQAYAAVEAIDFEGAYFRRDIGRY